MFIMLNCSDEVNHLNKASIAKYATYMFIGGLSSSCNLALALIIANGLLNRRKIFLLIKFLALAEFIEGIATLVGGGYRVAALLSRLNQCSAVPLYCVILPQSWLWRWSHIVCPLLCLVITLDRLFAVYHPQVYFFASRKTNYYVLFGCILIGCINVVIWFWYPLFQMENRVNAMCKSDEFLSVTYYQLTKKIAAVISSASVLLYVAVLVQLQRLLAPMDHASVWQQIQIKKSSEKHRITITLGICAAIRLVIDSLPRVYGSFFLITEETEMVASYFFVFNELNAVLCCIVIALRHREILEGGRRVLRIFEKEKDEKSGYRISFVLGENSLNHL